MTRFSAVRNLLRLLNAGCEWCLGNRYRRGLNTWLARLPMEAKEKANGVTSRRIIAMERGREAVSLAEIPRQLMQRWNFYLMVAATKRIG